MKLEIDNPHRYFGELRSSPEVSCPPLASEDTTADLGELVEETYHRGVLADLLPADTETVRVTIQPIWLQQPFATGVRVELAANDGEPATYSLEFDSGPWVRRAQLKALQLREEGTLGTNQKAYRTLVALSGNGQVPFQVPPLQTPPLLEESLEEVGVRRLGEGELVPDRPVLVNGRLAADAIQRCEDAGLTETGGAVLGKTLRLPEPIPGTSTRIVTLLTATVDDPRHTGSEALFTFSPEALAEAARIGDIRGLGESVMTVFHTHGWSPDCRNCNKTAQCPLAECSPSLQDYQLAATLFPGKGTLLPIVGRKLGAQGDHPVFRIHAWRGGEMRAIRWQAYQD